MLITKGMRTKWNDFKSAFLLHYGEVPREKCRMKYRDFVSKNTVHGCRGIADMYL